MPRKPYLAKGRARRGTAGIQRRDVGLGPEPHLDLGTNLVAVHLAPILKFEVWDMPTVGTASAISLGSTWPG